ncbi:hypothetical protein D3C85_1635440 [compost metagenome]
MAGIGIAPHTPEPPLTTLVASLASASFWPAYFAATSLNAGPTSLFATAWQAMQFLALARSAFAIADCAAKADTATIPNIRNRFIVFSIVTTFILTPFHNAGMIARVDGPHNIIPGIGVSFVR